MQQQLVRNHFVTLVHATDDPWVCVYAEGYEAEALEFGEIDPLPMYHDEARQAAILLAEMYPDRTATIWIGADENAARDTWVEVERYIGNMRFQAA